jgi:hypothetical protein
VTAALRKALTAFGRFWWDFLVGDTPELFVGTVATVITAVVLHRHLAAAVVAVPLVVILFLSASVWRGRSRSRGRSG